jgi:hypothetical protein
MGGFSFGAESTFFDKLMSLPKNSSLLILRIKLVISALFSVLCAIIYCLVFIDKISVFYWTSIFFFGFLFLFLIFQTIVYNRQRIDIFAVPKFPNSTIYSYLTIGGMFMLQGIIFLVKWLTSETTANWIMLITGILMAVSSPFWLKNIYKRFLKRKYQNMEEFRMING